jgi:hypothetical protein
LQRLDRLGEAPESARAAAAVVGGASHPDARDLSGGNDASHYRVTALLVSAILLLSTAAAIFLVFRGAGATPIVVGTLLSLLLAALPILICHVQGTSRERQLARLDSISDHPVAQTAYYAAARRAISAIEPVALDRYYLAPIATLCTVLAFGFLAIFLVTNVDRVFLVRSFLFGGQKGLLLSGDELALYQRGTFLMLAMAFLGSYVYMLFRFLFRILNNDIYPMTFYYYAVRLIISCIVAVTFRHLFDLFGMETSQLLVLIGFAIGFAPDLFILAMARRAFQFIKVAGDQPDPEASALPTNLHLLMIEGMTRDRIDRLGELGIDSAHYLACQNPFMLWPRLPYDLRLLVDWIAQAQLYKWAKEARLKKMREIGVSNIFDLYTGLSDDAARPSLCQALDIDPSCVAAHLNNLEQDPPFRRLREVRDAL